MSDSSRFSGYHIPIGGEYLIDRYLHGILAVAQVVGLGYLRPPFRRPHAPLLRH